LVGPNGRWYPRIGIEDRIWDGQRTSVSATVGRTFGASRGVPRQIRTRGAGLGDDFKAASLQRHFWFRNAPYASMDPANPLKIATNACTLRAHQRHKLLIQKYFRDFSTPHCYSHRKVTILFRADFPCWIQPSFGLVSGQPDVD
jgi:hypothetical protein